jgi:predicted DsbA family dithiol-disulfide isomerase
LREYRERHPDRAEPAVRWLPFQLNPDMPPEGMPRQDYIARKWGPGRGNEIYSRVAGVGSSVGIPFAFEKIRVQPNTLNAHRLLYYAERAGDQNALAEELFRAYFLEGANLTDKAALAGVAARAGMDRDEVAAYLESGEDRDVILNADLEARESGISGVPFFIFNRKVGVSGAQEAEALLAAMEQALKSRDA